MEERPRPDDTAYLAGLVRDRDRPRYYAALFAPEKLRADLFALYGFAAEIERIPDQVKDPTLGRIRLQWWADSLTGDAGQAARGETPALRAVLSLIRRHGLPISMFETLIEARDADLYSDPPATVAELESFFEETEAVLFRTGAMLSGWTGPEAAEAARHAGLAYGLTRRLARFGFDRASGRTILPLDALAAEGIAATGAYSSASGAALHRVILTLIASGRYHLGATQGASIPRQTLPVFLPIAVIQPLLRRIEQGGGEAIQENAAISDFKTLIRIGWAGLRGQV